MIQPGKYPLLIGQSLVFEPDPFVAMVDDDNPWIEGLFLTVSFGVIIGVAKVIGALLLTASMPDFAAFQETLLNILGQIELFKIAGNPVAFEQTVRQIIGVAALQAGYGAGWLSLLAVVLVPLTYLVQWFYFGLVGYAVARLLGGSGSLNATLGATALAVAPRVLLLFTVFPFASVSGALLLVWSGLIVFRGLEVAHELSWQQSAIATLLLIIIPVAVLLIIALLSVLAKGVL